MSGIVPESVLAEHGLRITAQRVAVLAEVAREEGDVTAQELHARLRARGTRVGLATVYRTLDALAEAGVLDTLPHGTETCYRHCTSEHHHHLTCRSCHRVVEVLECDLGAWARRVGSRHGFADVAHEVELYGTCGRCVGTDGS